jgi:iron complex outermembrane recepter protein
LQTDYNLGRSVESGIDVQASYRLGLGAFGSLTTTLNGSYLQHSITTPYPGAQTFDCVGLFGPDCNTNSINPRWRHTLRVSWQTPWDKLLVSANWRFIGSTTLDNNSSQPALMFAEFGEYDGIDARIPNYSYLDLSATLQVWRNVELRAGVNNVLDKNPPVISSELTGSGTPNTYPTYDELGRNLFIAFTAKF